MLMVICCCYSYIYIYIYALEITSQSEQGLALSPFFLLLQNLFAVLKKFTVIRAVDNTGNLS